MPLNCMLANRGMTVIGVDPDAASLELAQAKPGAHLVRWVHGDISAVPSGTRVDVVTMTANVAQVFLTDEDWHLTLERAFTALRPGGRIVFETRDPSQRAWRKWTKDKTRSRADVPGLGVVEGSVETTMVDGPFVTFGGEYTFHRGGVVLTPRETTLRFRSRDEVTASLRTAGFVFEGVRDAPDRPGKEFVFIALRPHSS
jgi:SAM-dependent methyltransferase